MDRTWEQCSPRYEARTGRSLSKQIRVNSHPSRSGLQGFGAPKPRANLPGLDAAAAWHSDNVEAAMALRMCLRQDQGVPEWSWRP